jgi:5,10-methylene-tetrahydrofolate dehydrogenase/methenyl tetrahydrofolate cyclohydrolase
VPGGVGPMTIAQLMFNVVDLVLQKTDKNSWQKTILWV